MADRLCLCLTVFIFLLNSCTPKKDTITDDHAVKPELSAVTKKQDSCKTLLSDGCIVLRRGNDVISEMFSMFNKTDKSYSHCGIAFRENNVWYVYHSIGGEDNPDEKLRKDTYEQFIIPAHNTGFGICDLSLKIPEISKLHHIVDSLYKHKVPFDMKFDLQSNDRLYCAEMVYKSVQAAVNNDSLFTTTRHNGFQFISTDNIFVNKQAQILCRVNY